MKSIITAAIVAVTLSTAPAAKAANVVEVYSPQRVIEVWHKYNFVRGDSLDFRTGFDPSDPELQQRESRIIVETQSVLVILRPHVHNFLYTPSPQLAHSWAGVGRSVCG